MAPLDIIRDLAYDDVMRVFEVVLRSGAKVDVTAESLHDDIAEDNKVYFYRDKTHKHLVAYFLRDEVAGVILGPDNPSNLQKASPPPFGR